MLLPSSTLPAVMKRRTPWSVEGGVAEVVRSSEISFALAPFHRGVGGLVVHAGRAALGDLGDRGLDDDLSSVAASLSTGQVQVMSPTVRKRTDARLDRLARAAAA